MDGPPNSENWNLTTTLSPPAGIEPISMSRLTPLQRILLSTDGTVTEILQAHFFERMNPVMLDQCLLEQENHPQILAVTADDRMLRRKILLRGASSNVSYLYAETTLALNRMKDRLAAELMAGIEPIGTLLRKYRVETYREILWFGREGGETLSAILPIASDQFVLTRQYAIVSREKPFMLVTEKFLCR